MVRVSWDDKNVNKGVVQEFLPTLVPGVKPCLLILDDVWKLEQVCTAHTHTHTHQGSYVDVHCTHTHTHINNPLHTHVLAVQVKSTMYACKRGQVRVLITTRDEKILTRLKARKRVMYIIKQCYHEIMVGLI